MLLIINLKKSHRISKSTRYGTWLVRFPTQEDTTAYIGSTLYKYETRRRYYNYNDALKLVALVANVS